MMRECVRVLLVVSGESKSELQNVTMKKELSLYLNSNYAHISLGNVR